MDVHAHSHTARKKWTHYLWEFLMLFLAVFCGFLAENQREHIIEHKRENTFMRTMTEDIKSDTAQLQNLQIIRSHWHSQMDSLLILLNSKNRDSYQKEIYLLFAKLNRSARFISNDRTIQQLKNAGNMRLIKKQNVSDSIIHYDQRIRRQLYLSEMESQMKYDNRNKAFRIFDAIELDKIYKGEIIDSLFHPKLLTTDPVLINEFCGDLVIIIRMDVVNMNIEQNILWQSLNLLDLIRKEYHLE